MIFAKHNIFADMTIKKSIIMSAVVLVLLVVWGRFYYIDRLMLDSKLPFGMGKNPPSITLVIWSLIILFFCCGFFSLLEQIKIISVISSVCSIIGRHTLYIFLFHFFLLNNICIKLPIESIWLKRIVYFGIMIGGSIILEYTAKILKKLIFTEPAEIENKEPQPIK